MCVHVGPTVLEVFNTLLRQLRQSVDYELTGFHDAAGNHKTTSTEEKTLQDAVIKTIGLTLSWFCSRCDVVFKVVSLFELVLCVQDLLPTHFLSTRGQRS